MHERAIIIPARLGSQRFPGKLLHPVMGKPLILWTAENIRRIAPELHLCFAVAEKQLQDALEAEGYECVMTDPELPSGTDRLAEANKVVQAEWVINVQADEPVLAAEHLKQLLEVMDSGVDVATLATPFDHQADFADPNKVKVVRGAGGRALYFSRAPIPHDRDSKGGLPPQAYWHLGLYGYHRRILERFTTWEQGYLEKTETVGVDVPEDLDSLIEFLQGR